MGMFVSYLKINHVFWATWILVQTCRPSLTVVSMQIIFVHWFLPWVFLFCFWHFIPIFPLLIYLLYCVHLCEQPRVLFRTKSKCLSPDKYLFNELSLRNWAYYSQSQIKPLHYDFWILVCCCVFEPLGSLRAPQCEPWAHWLDRM